MKTIVKILSLLVALLALASCGGPKLVSIIPVYVGAPVTDTFHEFKKEDFYVLASYEDGTDEQVTDFTFEVVGMERGYYIIHVAYKDKANPCSVAIHACIYPSDSETTAETEHTHEHTHEH